jgi:AcrR family transcriptional regulator
MRQRRGHTPLPVSPLPTLPRSGPASLASSPPAATAAAGPASGAAPSETQRRILDAALALFAERGYDGVSTAQIAARAEVAEKTLFANFGSKQRLYEATLGPAGLRLILFPEALRTLLPVLEHPPADPAGLLRALIENRIAFLRDHVREARLIIQHVLRQPESAVSISDLWTERILPVAGALLSRLVASGQLRDDIPIATVVRMVMAQMVGYGLARAMFRPDLPWDDQREIANMVDVLLHGLAPRKPEAPKKRGMRPRQERK